MGPVREPTRRSSRFVPLAGALALLVLVFTSPASAQLALHGRVAARAPVPYLPDGSLPPKSQGTPLHAPEGGWVYRWIEIADNEIKANWSLFTNDSSCLASLTTKKYDAASEEWIASGAKKPCFTMSGGDYGALLQQLATAMSAPEGETRQALDPQAYMARTCLKSTSAGTELVAPELPHGDIRTIVVRGYANGTAVPCDSFAVALTTAPHGLVQGAAARVPLDSSIKTVLLHPDDWHELKTSTGTITYQTAFVDLLKADEGGLGPQNVCRARDLKADYYKITPAVAEGMMECKANLHRNTFNPIQGAQIWVGDRDIPTDQWGYYFYENRRLGDTDISVTATVDFAPFTPAGAGVSQRAKVIYEGKHFEYTRGELSSVDSNFPVDVTIVAPELTMTNDTTDESSGGPRQGGPISFVSGAAEGVGPYAAWPPGQTAYSFPAGTAIDRGMLRSISVRNFADTTVYVFRATGTVLGSRWGLADNEITVGTEPLASATMSVRGPASMKAPLSALYQLDVVYRSPLGTACEDQNAAMRENDGTGAPSDDPLLQGPSAGCSTLTRESLAGQDVTIVAQNHATGYLGAVRQQGIGTLLQPKITLAPPNLRIWAERKRSGADSLNRIGAEGAGLISDDQIVVYTDFRAADGSPLPANLPGYTGRLARSVRDGSAELPQQTDPATPVFPIRPGFHAQVVKLPAGSKAEMGHYYIHVAGVSREEGFRPDPPTRKAPYGPSFSTTQICRWAQPVDNDGESCDGVDSDADGKIDEGCGQAQVICEEREEGEAPEYSRPWTFVPFKVPTYDKPATDAAKRFARANGLPVPDPIYRWNYSPEYHFSLLDLEGITITRTLADGSKLPIVSGPPPADATGFVAGNDQRLDVVWTLITDPESELARPAPRVMEWQLGDVVARDDGTGKIYFDDPGAFQRLHPEDLIALDLVQDGDEANVLWKLDFTRIDYHLENGASSINVGETVVAIAETHPAGELVDWKLITDEPNDKPDDGVVVKVVRIDDRRARISVSEESKEGFFTLEAYMVKKPEIKVRKRIKVGCECEPCKVPGHCEAVLGSVSTHWSVGKAANGSSAGTLFLESEQLGEQLGKPRALRFSTLANDIEVIRDQNGLKQISAPGSLVDIAVVSATSYVVNFYEAAAQGAKKADGSFAVNGGFQPMASWTITATATELNISGQEQGRETSFKYTRDDSTGEWSLQGGDARVVSRSAQQTGDIRVVREKTKGLDGNVSSDVESTYQTFPWGEALVLEVKDPDGEALTTRYTYHQADPGKGRVQSIEYPDSSWVSYGYDTKGRVTTESRPWLDSSITDLGNARTIQNSFAAVDPRDTELAKDEELPRTVVEYVQGVEVLRTYYAHIEASGERTEVVERVAQAGASYGANGNLRTTMIFVLEADSRRPRRFKRVEYPDERVDTYQSEYGAWISGSFRPGAGSAHRETVTHGTRSQPNGEPGKSTREVQIEDRLGNLVHEETSASIGGAYVVMSSTDYLYDRSNRLRRTSHSNGTFSAGEWGCCGYDTFIDEQGIQSTFEYDRLGRVATEQRSGITMTHVYDSTGREVENIRTSSAGTMRSSRVYDRSGRLRVWRDEAGRETHYAYSQDGRTTTLTRPGGATEVTRMGSDGRVVSVTGSAVVPQYSGYGLNPDGSQWAETRVGDASAPQYERTTFDMLGRTIRVERPGFGGTTEVIASHYDARGRLVRQTSPGFAATLFEYDAMGNQTRTGLDVDGNGRIDLNGVDRVHTTETQFVMRDAVWEETVRRVYAADGDATATTVNTRRTRLGGFSSNTVAEEEIVDIHGNVTRSRTLLNAAGATLTQLVDVPESPIDQLSISIEGRLVSTTSSTGLTTAFGYDGFGRRNSVVNPRTGTTSTGYDAQGRVSYVEDAEGRRTSFGYEPATGYKITETNSEGKVTRFAYNQRGELSRTWGDVPYPVEYEYDAEGRRHRMRTYRQALGWNEATWPSGAVGDTTSWEYDAPTGLLTAKRDASGGSVRYTYGPGGRLATRTWARTQPGGAPLTTTYGYHPVTAELVAIDYSDATPDTAFVYDRLGRTKQVTHGAGMTSFTYLPSTLLLATETRSGLVPALIGQKYASDGVHGRSMGFTMGSAYDVAYNFDAVGRIGGVAWNISGQSDSVTYTRLANSELLAGAHYASGATTTYGYAAKRDLKTQVKNVLAGTSVSQYDYQYDGLGRRTSLANSGLAFENPAFSRWKYDDRGEVIESERYLGTDVNQTSSPIASEYRAYQFDPIGNRTTATEGSQQRSYQANLLNEYTVAAGAALSYDADGNLTNDGSRKFTYDAENRLVLVEPVVAASGALRVRMAYDHIGRRVQKVVEQYDGSAWTAQDDVRWVYVGWSKVEERHESAGGSTKRNFVWGLDLSQDMYRAGGIGGLLGAVDEAGSQVVFLYDGNGNVSQLLNESGSVVARYEYDAFGNVLVADGPAAEENSYRFSTKYQDLETGLLYYGYRFYEPRLGRWVTRDPAEEDKGGPNLFAFAWNNPVNRFDAFGLNPDSVEDVIKQLQARANANGVNFARVRLWAANVFIEGPPFVVLGNRIHEAVFDNYKKHLPRQGIFDNTVTEILVRLGAKGNAGGEGWLRPDIVNRRTKVLYEVKSIRGAWVALEEVADYIRVFKKAGVCITPGRRGLETDGVKAWPSGLQVEWYGAEPGAILYEFTDLPDPSYLPVPSRSLEDQKDRSENFRWIPQTVPVPQRSPALETMPLWLLILLAAGAVVLLPIGL